MEDNRFQTLFFSLPSLVEVLKDTTASPAVEAKQVSPFHCESQERTPAVLRNAWNKVAFVSELLGIDCRLTPSRGLMLNFLMVATLCRAACQVRGEGVRGTLHI